MARKTKKETEQDTINIKYTPMKIKGSSAFKCINDDWGVVAFDIRREQLENSNIQFGDTELQYNCIYFLVGIDGIQEKVYVGQAKKRNGSGSVLNRLREHTKSQTEVYRNIWARAIVVTGKEDTWGPTELNALEHIFYRLIPSERRLNGNEPNAGITDLRAFNEKVKQIELYLTTLGVDIFYGADDSEKVTVQSITNDYSTVEDLQNGLARIPEIVTPKKVVKSMIDMLPPEVWNSTTTFLDPACKGGEYLKEIYNRLMETEELKALYPNEFARANHILSKQIFGIALSEVSKKRTTDTLNGFTYNIKIIPNYINILKGKSEKTVKDILSEEFNGNMKFDVVIGNPPYQDERSSIYPKFIELGISISNITCMITRDNWMQGKAFRELRKNLTENGGVKTIIHYPVVSEVFKGVSVAVATLLWQKGYKGDTQYTCIRHGKLTVKQELDITKDVIYKTPEAKSILNKVGERYTWVETFQTRSYPFMDQRKRYSLDKQLKPSREYNVAIMSNDGVTEYTSIDNFRNVDEVRKYKVLCGVIINEASIENPGNVLTNIKAVRPYVVSSETWSLIAIFNTEEETINCKKYIKTKLI